jgi:hypothetical protein
MILAGWFETIDGDERVEKIAQSAARDAGPAADGSLARCQRFYQILYRSSEITAVTVKSPKDRLSA